jgi:tRNA 5-methylaminomethyl-2-thiouridine biosynthesis bifunctional protein
LQRLDCGQWQVRDARGDVLDQSDLVILAAGHHTQALIAPWLPPGSVPLQAVRGQVSWALHTAGEELPPLPVNGHGSLVPDYPAEGGRAWLLGATFDRDQDDAALRPADHAAALAKLWPLLPRTAASLAPRFERAQVQAWAGVRCSWRDHLPVVGPLSPQAPGLWLCTGFGSRGLSYSALCAELIAAWLGGEPLPLEPRLAQQLAASRLLKLR